MGFTPDKQQIHYYKKADKETCKSNVKGKLPITLADIKSYTRGKKNTLTLHSDKRDWQFDFNASNDISIEDFLNKLIDAGHDHIRENRRRRLVVLERLLENIRLQG